MTEVTAKPLVLIADDSAINRKYLSVVLAEKYRLIEAEDGYEALQSVGGDDKPDLILLDLMMPRVDGREVLRHLRSAPLTQAIPVIVITSDGSEAAEEQCLELGADDFLCRPFRRNSLILRSHNLIHRRSLQNDLAAQQLIEVPLLLDAKEAMNSDDAENFSVNNRELIVRIFRKLADKMDPVSAVLRDGSDVLITAVLDVNPDANAVYLDTNVSSAYNDRLLLSKRTIFVCAKEGVKVQWLSTEVDMVEYKGHEAFRIAIPETLQHIQKRRLFRIETPVINPLTCRMPISGNSTVELPLVDLCAEGFGAILPDPPVPEIKKGAIFKNCSIGLPEIGEVQVTLVVMGVWKTTLKNGVVSHRAGLEFLDIRSGIQSKVQRYINRLQRSRITE